MGILITVLAAAALSFSQIGTKQGLAQSTVVSICQDSRGFMWFSTNTGLVRYDGSNMKFYRNDPDDPASIPSDIVSKICQDEYLRLWICTESGLSEYRSATDDFVSYTLPENLPAKDVCTLSRDSLLVATQRNLHILDLRTGEFSEAIFSKHLIPLTLLKTDGRILIGSHRKCLMEYDRKENRIRQFLTGNSIPGYINDIIPRSHTEYWLATEGGGLVLFDLKKGILATYGPDRLVSGRVRALCYDSLGRLWIGTREGLDILDEKTGRIVTMPNLPEQDEGISYKSIKSIVRDTRGGMWLGTYFGGINYWNPYENKFEACNGITGDNVAGFLTNAPDGSIWVGSNSGEIVSFDPSTGKRSSIISKDDFGFFDIKAMTFSEDGRKVYVGMHGGGIGEIDLASRTKRNLIGNRDVYVILPWKDGKYFVAALSGLYIFEPGKGIFERCREAPVFFRLFAARFDSRQRLWAGGKDGLRVFSVNAGGELKDVTPEPLLVLRNVICFHETPDGKIWIGTGTGLYSYNPVSSGLEKIPLESARGAASAVAIVEDGAGRLWISSEDGLFCHTPGSGVTRRYGTDDGLSGERFNYNAVIRRPDGHIWLGGISGLTGFDPLSFGETPVPQRPLIVGARVFDRDVRPAGGLIRLRHDENTVSFSLASMDYSASGSNKFQFKLEGVDKDWIETKDPVSSTYANLKRGSYTFRLRSVTPEGIHVEADSPVTITVAPAWHETALARIMFILLLSAGAILALRFRQRQHDMAHELEIQRLKKEQEEMINHLRAAAYTGKEDTSAAEDRFIVKVGKHIEENISNPSFGVQELANLMGMSRANLNIRIKDATGESPIDLIRKIRFNEACRLLKDESLNIAEIAYRTGFTSPSYFATSFKKAFGISPKQYVEGK